jgi:threonine/homoserine/homoserine lactone efflux protein
LPQVAPGGATFLVLLLRGLTFCTMTLLWLSACAAAVESAGGPLRRPRTRRVPDAATGATVAAVGPRLAADGR